MRTKTLLLTAALSAAGIATSMAQVYSVNAVGYVNIPVVAGFNMIANQFTASSYAISNVIPSAPPASTAFVFANNNYTTSDFDEFNLAWTNPNLQLALGAGLFLKSPSAGTITIVGEVPQGTLTTAIPAGFSIKSSQVPQAGLVEDLGLVPGNNDTIFRFIPAVQNYAQYTVDEFSGDWVANTPGFPVDAAKGPAVAVGEAFWYNNAAGTATWTRNFTVN